MYGRIDEKSARETAQGVLNSKTINNRTLRNRARITIHLLRFYSDLALGNWACVPFFEKPYREGLAKT